MLYHLKKIYGIKLHASDGDLGKIRDFYYDDVSYAVRYAVAQTGSWLTEREVLLSPRGFGRLNLEDHVWTVELTQKQIADSPPLESHRPVSRQYEEAYHTYYSWPYYWGDDVIFSGGGYGTMIPATLENEETLAQRHQHDDPHLRSTQAVQGFKIEAMDGTIGHVSDFLMDSATWSMRFLLVESGPWYSGKEVLIPMDKITRIDHEASRVHIALTKADLEQTGEHLVATSHAEGSTTGSASLKEKSDAE